MTEMTVSENLRKQQVFFLMKTILIMIIFLVSVTPSFADIQLEREVLAELNLARTKPAVYAGILREYRRLFRGRNIHFSGSATIISTTEGVKAVDEAVSFLARQEPLHSLEPCRGLAEAAADLAAEQGDSAETGHVGRKCGSMKQRIERYGQWKVQIGENISYGYSAPRLIVIQLIVDDGIPGRGHRANIFNRTFKQVGVACGPHAAYRSMCVMDFAGGFSM
jgi:uncharacterized protein YkwD